jgi:hypothetical protein
MFFKSDTPNPDKPEPNPDSEIRNWGICLKLRYSYFEFFLPKNTKITTKELITPPVYSTSHPLSLANLFFFYPGLNEIVCIFKKFYFIMAIAP